MWVQSLQWAALFSGYLVHLEDTVTVTVSMEWRQTSVMVCHSILSCREFLSFEWCVLFEYCACARKAQPSVIYTAFFIGSLSTLTSHLTEGELLHSLKMCILSPLYVFITQNVVYEVTLRLGSISDRWKERMYYKTREFRFNRSELQEFLDERLRVSSRLQVIHHEPWLWNIEAEPLSIRSIPGFHNNILLLCDPTGSQSIPQSRYSTYSSVNVASASRTSHSSLFSHDGNCQC